jgi:two-component sensor histidine kinase
MRLHPEQTLSAEVVMVTAAWSATPKDETPLPRPHDQSPMAIDLKEDRPAAWLAREVDHHVNNLLGLIQAMVCLTKANTVQDLKATLEGRIRALAHAHDLLMQSRWAEIDLRALIDKEVAPFYPRLRIDGPSIALQPCAAQPIALVLNELTTNAVKHGALSRPHGRVHLAWRRTQDGPLTLHWAETGVPVVRAPTPGTGLKLIERMICTQLNGTVHLKWGSDGLACDLSFGSPSPPQPRDPPLSRCGTAAPRQPLTHAGAHLLRSWITRKR